METNKRNNYETPTSDIIKMEMKGLLCESKVMLGTLFFLTGGSSDQEEQTWEF